MLLYATLTSERASKGQGGNEYLHVSLKGENEQDLGMIKLELVKNISGEFYQITYFQIGLDTPDALLIKTIDKTKGKSQKGEKYCTQCGNVEAQTGKHCQECGNKLVYHI